MQPPFCKVVIRPTLIFWYSLGVPAMSFEEHPTQAAANHFVVLAEDTPVTVPEVVEPSLDGTVDALNSELQRISRFAGSHLADAVDELAVAFLARETEFPAKGVAQK